MTTNFQQLRIQQLDAALTHWRDATLPSTPSTGWVRAIRNALGMSSAALAKRLGVTGSAVRKLEEAESEDAITLGTLRRVAAALDCELQYALIPKRTLDATRYNQAMSIAQKRVASVANSMALEDQAVDSDITLAQIKEVAQSLLSKRGTELW